MAKKQHYSFSRKFMPAGARRITKEDGSRVWLIGDKEYTSKREFFEAARAIHEKLMAMMDNAPVVEQPEEAETTSE